MKKSQPAPLLSIVTPCLNAEETILSTLQSVKQVYNQMQTLRLTIEHIVIDGNSEDRTIGIISEFAAKADYLKLANEKATGIYRAMNKGLELANGEYTHILNADDYISDAIKYCELTERALQRNKKIILGSITKINHKTDLEIETWKAKGQQYNAQRFEAEIKRGNHYPHPGFIAKTTIYRAVGFDEKYTLSADYKLMQTILLNHVKRDDVLISEDPFIAMGTGGATSTFPGIIRGARQIRAINKELGITGNLAGRYTEKFSRVIAQHFRKPGQMIRLYLKKAFKI